MAAKDSKNPFLQGSSDFIRPNARFSPKQYQSLALYVMLYNDIKGSLADYKFEDRITLDAFIDNRIAEVMKICRRIYDNRINGLNDDFGYTGDKKLLEIAKDWMNRLLPTKSGIAKDHAGNDVYVGSTPIYDRVANEENIKFVDFFLSNYGAVKTESTRISELYYGDKNKVLTVGDVNLLLQAKKEKVREFYENCRGNQDYKPGKYDKEGKQKGGTHATAYYNGLNQLEHKKRLLKRNNIYNLLKGGAMLGFGGLLVVSGGALLSFGGLALTSIFGTMFSSAGIGGALLGALGTAGGFFGVRKYFRQLKQGLRKSYDMNLEIRDFKGKEYKGKDLEIFLAGDWEKRENLTLNEIKALYMYDKAVKSFFELRGGKDDPKFPEELKMYLPDEIIKKWKLDKDKEWFDYVSDRNSQFSAILEKSKNVVQKVEGSGEYDHTEFLGRVKRMLDPTNTPSIGELVNLSNEIREYSSKITPAKAAAYQTQLSNKLVESIMHDILEQPYVDSSLSSNQALLKDSKFATIVENSTTPNAKEKISDIIGFIAGEKGSEDKPLDSSVGVKIASQYATSASDILSVALSLDESMDDATKTVVQTVSSAIADSSRVTKQAFTVATPPDIPIKTMVDNVKATNPKAGNYLEFILNKKIQSSKNNAESIEDELTSGITTSDAGNIHNISIAIANMQLNDDGSFMSGTKTLKEIREWIVRPDGMVYVGLNPDEQKMATKMLDEQIESLERAKREKARTESFKIVSSGSYEIPKGTEFITLKVVTDSIDSITYDQITTAETKKLYEETILKVTPQSLQDYLKLKFSNKIETLFKNYISEHESELQNGTEALTLIAKLLSSVQNNKFLSESEKERIIKEIEPKIASAFNTKLTNMEKLLLGDIGKDEYDVILDDFMKKTYQEAGFVDYFNQNTIESKKIKSRIEKLERGLILKELLQAGGLEEVPTIIDENSADTRTFLKIYFDESKPREVTDGLITVLTAMQTISTTSNLNCLQKSSYNPAPNGFMEQMTTFINTDIVGGTLDNRDKLAALLIAKKRTLAMFKLHMYRFIQGEANPSAYITGAGSANLMAIKGQWESLLLLIDNTYSALKAQPENVDITAKYIPAKDSVDRSLGSDKFVNFMKSQQLQPSL